MTLTDLEFLALAQSTDADDASWMKWFLRVWMPATYIFLAALIYFVGKRRNWARIAWAVLTVGGLGLLAWAWTESYETAMSWGEAGLTLLDLVALYWLFTGPGAEWFRTRNNPSEVS